MSFLSFILFGVVTKGTEIADGIDIINSKYSITGFDCGGEPVLKVLKFVMDLIDIILFLVPMALIVMVMVDFFKNVIAGREDDMKKNLSIAIKRILYCVALFLINPIINFTINMLGDLGVDYADCIQIAQTEDLSQYKIEWSDDVSNDNNINLFPGNSFEAVDDGEDETDKESADNSSSSSDGENSTADEAINENLSNYTKIVYVGDSRFQGMKSVVSYDDEKEIWITKVGAGYSWLTSTALSSINNNSSIKSEDKVVVVFNLGVNDFDNVKNYYSTYNKFVNVHSNWKIVFVSVNPINDKLAASNGYSVKNTDVIRFNKTMKLNLNDNISYCDVYSKVKSSFNTDDGIHYQKSTSIMIYEEIQKCL